jgi:hypothetical protein
MQLLKARELQDWEKTFFGGMGERLNLVFHFRNSGRYLLAPEFVEEAVNTYITREVYKKYPKGIKDATFKEIIHQIAKFEVRSHNILAADELDYAISVTSSEYLVQSCA